MARNRILYFDLLLFLFAVHVLLEGWLFHLLFLFFLLLPLLSVLLVLPLRYSVRVRLAAEEDLTAKGSYPLQVVAENRCILPCGCVRAVFCCENALGRGSVRQTEEPCLQFSLRPFEKLQLEPMLQLSGCGRWDVSVKKIDVYDPLGIVRLAAQDRAQAASTASIYVLPEPVRRALDAEKTADLGRDSDTYSTDKPGADPAELFQLRDYRAGDARHSIHWKLSGRLNRLIVREFGLPLSPSLCFLISLSEGVRAADAEGAVATLLSVSEYLISKDTPHRMGWIDADGALRMTDVVSSDDLADALHALLALPACTQRELLLQYLSTQPPQPELHLLLLSAGLQTEDADEDRLLTAVADGGFCRRLTLLNDGFTVKRAQHLQSLGCEAYLMDGRHPEAVEVL